MPTHELAGGRRGVAVVGVHNTRQARALEGETSRSVTLGAIRGAVADAGISLRDLDGFVVHSTVPGGSVDAESKAWAYSFGVERFWSGSTSSGLVSVLEAAAAIASGQCTTAVVASGQAGLYEDRSSTAPWTRPQNEWVEWCGLFTAAEFALVARRHMHLYGTTPEQMAHVAATIRNFGHTNPAAVYHGRGPYTVDDILGSRMVADPFHLLDCAMTAEGGSAVVLTAAEQALDFPHPPAYLLAGASEACGPGYSFAPTWDLAGMVGAGAAKRAFGVAGLRPEDVQACELYDPFSFEIIRQFEAFGFCEVGEGGDFVTSGVIGPGQRFPVSTDGGTMSHSHTGQSQMIQKVVQAVRQVRGDAPNQVAGCRVALASTAGSGAMNSAMLLVSDARS